MTYLSKTADLSDCGKYRFALTRTWDTTKPSCTFIGLNPSTADAYVDDPTIRRCVGFAKEWGCGTLMMVNLWPYRATDPNHLITDLPADVMARNDSAMVSAMLFSKYSIAAWGVHGERKERGTQVLSKYRHVLSYLKLSLDGYPCHPLYLPGVLKPKRFDDGTL